MLVPLAILGIIFAMSTREGRAAATERWRGVGRKFFLIMAAIWAVIIFPWGALDAPKPDVTESARR